MNKPQPANAYEESEALRRKVNDAFAHYLATGQVAIVNMPDLPADPPPKPDE